MAGLGTLFGLAAAAASSRLLSSQLFGVSAFDWPTYAGVSAATLAAAAFASWVPARRAARVEPVEALRCE